MTTPPVWNKRKAVQPEKASYPNSQWLPRKNYMDIRRRTRDGFKSTGKLKKEYRTRQNTARDKLSGSAIPTERGSLSPALCGQAVGAKHDESHSVGIAAVAQNPQILIEVLDEICHKHPYLSCKTAC
jgi:hypothetical protein